MPELSGSSEACVHQDGNSSPESSSFASFKLLKTSPGWYLSAVLIIEVQGVDRLRWLSTNKKTTIASAMDKRLRLDLRLG